MRTVISNKIYVYNASAALIGWCQEELTLVNPTYATMMRLGKQDTIKYKHIPENLNLYVSRRGLNGIDLILPFGVLYAIWRFIKDSPFEVNFNKNGQVIDQNMKITMPLFDYQEEAVEKMIEAGGGILEGACGCGKTQIGIEIAKRIGFNTLWLCHTGDLLSQTVGRIHKLYPNLPVGTITEGSVNMVKNGITVSTVQTLVNIDPYLYKDYFDVVITDECFPAGTKIITKNGEKNIEDIKCGDYVLSFNHKKQQTEYKKVTHLFVKTSSMLKQIKLNDIIVTATNNHPFYTTRGYVAAEDLRSGDYVLQSMQQSNYKNRCDKINVGSCKNERLYILQSSMCNIKQKETYLDFRIETSNGGKNENKKFNSSSISEKTSRNENQQSYGQFTSQGKNDSNKKTKWNVTFANKKSWRKWQCCALPGNVKSRTSKNGIENIYGISCFNPSNEGTETYLSHLLQDRYSNSEFDDSYRSRWTVSLWGEGEKERCKEKRILVWSRVESIQNFEQSNKKECERSCTVYNLEVEDNNNYFANNILVHNCHHLSGSPTLMKMHIKIVDAIPARYKFGLSATLTRTDTLIKSMYAYTGCNIRGDFAPTWKIAKDKTNTLTAKHIRVDLDTPWSYDCLLEDGTFSYPLLVEYLGQDKERNEAIADNVVKQAQKHPKQLVLCLRIEQCEVLNQMLQEKGINSVLLVGKVTKKKRQEILTQARDWQVVVATMAIAKEGLDVPELSCLHWAMVLSDKVATVQSAGRIERVSEGKPDPEIYDYVDINYPYCIGKWKKRVSFLKKR